MQKVWILILLSILLAACNNHDSYQGYIEGRYAYISANYPGILKELNVQRGDTVKSGQPLFVLEQQPESDQLKQAQAKFDLAKTILQRRQALIRKGAIQQESLDSAQSDFLQAQAALSQAQWTQNQKTISSPNEAFVFDTYYLPGELVPAGHPVLSLLASKDIKVIVYIPEPKLSGLQLGQTVKIDCDGCKEKISAKISFISPQTEYTPPVIYSNERRDKLVYRVEAMPSLSDAAKLHPGQPVMVEVSK